MLAWALLPGTWYADLHNDRQRNAIFAAQRIACARGEHAAAVACGLRVGVPE